MPQRRQYCVRTFGIPQVPCIKKIAIVTEISFRDLVGQELGKYLVAVGAISSDEVGTRRYNLSIRRRKKLLRQSLLLGDK